MKEIEKTVETLENAIQILNDTKSAFFDDHDVYMGYTKSYFNKVTSGLLSHIAELEVLQQRSCESCKHWKVSNTLVVSNECFKWNGNVMTPKDFCCNRYEAKDNA